ncbi:MAG: alpha-amylase family glycosyl hydrolase, partial [Bacteroidales bacterium]|uniref:alpha-amylase family glycosyl hydrolase n=1 Tax=Porphyromonas sp. TaxID=1924944 RepID=UPI0029778A39
YETVKLNYGIDLQGDWHTYFDPIPDTWRKMLDILCYWASKGVDGFRCDMAELVPSSFWHWVIGELRKNHPEILFIAEVYQPSRYEEYIEARFDYLYDKVGLYDKLIQILKGEGSTSEIGRLLTSQERVKHHLLRFMENHDEQRIASDFVLGDGALAFPAMCTSALIDGNPLMIYFGQELGESGMDCEGFSGRDGRTTIFDYWSVESVRDWLKGKEFELRPQYRWLLHTAQLPIFAQGSFYDLTYTNSSFAEQRLFVFMRALENEVALVVVNFSNDRQVVELNIPPHAFETLSIATERVYKVTEVNSNRSTFTTLSTTAPYSISAYPLTATIHLFDSPTDL